MAENRNIFGCGVQSENGVGIEEGEYLTDLAVGQFFYANCALQWCDADTKANIWTFLTHDHLVDLQASQAPLVRTLAEEESIVESASLL